MEPEFQLVLRCPREIPAVPALSRRLPLPLVPFLGATVLGHTLVHLAANGTRRIRVIAPDRTACVRGAVGAGEAWGIQLEVQAAASADGKAPEVLLDRLPQLPGCVLWRDYRAWQAAQLALIPVLGPARVGMRERQPGVFVGLRSQVAADARLKAPCWIGDHVHVGAGAVLGPGTVVEDGCYIDEGAEVVGSVVGPWTYIGVATEVRDSLAWGDELLHFDTGSVMVVRDAFLLGHVRRTTPVLDRLTRFWRKVCGTPRARAGAGASRGNPPGPRGSRTPGGAVHPSVFSDNLRPGASLSMSTSTLLK